jgi:hypothetical protein
MMLTIKEAAKKLGMKPAKLYRLIYLGQFRTTKRPGYVTLVEIPNGKTARA